MFTSVNRRRRARPRTPSRLWRFIKIVLLVVIPGTAWVAVNLPAVREYVDARKQRDQVLREVEQLKTEIAERKSEKARLLDRDFGDESVARSRKLVKPGEKIILLETTGEK